MKILMTTDAVGGVWHYATDLAGRLLEEEVKIVLICTGPQPNPLQLAHVEKLQKKGLTFYHSPYRLEWMEDPWKEIAQANAWITTIVEQEKPSLLHFNNFAPACLNWKLPVVLVAHSCVTSWWHMVKQEKLPVKYDYYYKTVKKAFLESKVVVFPSQGLLDVCSDLYGDINNPQVIYNGLEFSLPTPSYDVNLKRPVIFSVGRLWDEAKNILLLLEAAPFISGDIFIAGAGPENLPCPPNVTFLGTLSRPQIIDWLKISSVYVLPVKYEPFGLSFLEAASCRCAIVGGDIPTLREIWGDSMIYVPTDDPMILADTCNRLLTHPRESQQRGETAYRRSNKYDLDDQLNRYKNVYKYLLNKQLV